MILEEGELAGELVMVEEVEHPEVDLVERDDVEILGGLNSTWTFFSSREKGRGATA